MNPGTFDHIAFDSDSRAGRRWELVAVGDYCVAGRAAAGRSIDDLAAQAVGLELRAMIASATAAVANLEGPVRSGASPAIKAGPGLQLDPEAPALLAALGFTAAAMANNHVMDYGAEGLLGTVAACGRAGLVAFGAGPDEDRAMSPALVTIDGAVRIALLAFGEREFGVAGRRSPGSAWIGHPGAPARVTAAAREADVVIVFAHGGVEEVPLPPPERQDALRKLIDAGATLVIGHHPHVPQGWEMYGGGAIFYSLGNFIFDYPGGIRYPKTEWGIALRAGFDGKRLASIDVIPIAPDSDGRIDAIGDPGRAGGMLAYLRGLGEIMSDRDMFEGYWQAIAVHLWETRYRKWLQKAAGATGPRDGMRDHASGLLRAVRRRLGGGASRGLPELDDPAMILNLIRNESHRWAIETALALRTGDIADLRTPAIEAHLRELLRWTED